MKFDLTTREQSAALRMLISTKQTEIENHLYIASSYLSETQLHNLIAMSNKLSSHLMEQVTAQIYAGDMKLESDYIPILENSIEGLTKMREAIIGTNNVQMYDGLESFFSDVCKENGMDIPQLYKIPIKDTAKTFDQLCKEVTEEAGKLKNDTQHPPKSRDVDKERS